MKCAVLTSMVLAVVIVCTAAVGGGAEVPASDADAIQAVEALLEAGRRKAGVRPTGPVSDEVFLRRVSLDIIGRIPTVDEAREFLDAPPTPDKRARLIDRLLASEGHVSHFYNHWADVFRIRESRWGHSAILAFREWLKQSIRENRPWNRMVFEIMNATGNCLESPAVGYWYRDYKMPLDNLASTTQVFLATQLDCAMCHDHPFDRWSQHQFYELAAFLNEPHYVGYMPGWVTKDDLRHGVPLLKQFPVEMNGKTVLQWRELPPRRRAAEDPRVAEQFETMSVADIAAARGEVGLGGQFREYQQNWSRARTEVEGGRRRSGFYATKAEGDRRYAAARFVEQTMHLFDFTLRREGRERIKLPDDYQYDDAKPGDWVKPAVPFGELPKRRDGQPIHAVLADWTTADDNPRFTKAIANRLFAHVFGGGLYPVHDGIRDEDVSSHPELTEFLETLMRQGGYDMRRFLRILYNTPTYQSAAVMPEAADDPAVAAPSWPRSFQGHVVRRLSAEQFWDSIVTLSLPDVDDRRSYYRYHDTGRWMELDRMRPEAVFEEGLRVVEEEYQMRLVEAIAPAEVHYSHKPPELVPLAKYRGYSEELARASELAQPADPSHFLRVYGASDRETIENGYRATTVPQVLALMNRLVDHYVLAGQHPRSMVGGSPTEQMIAQSAEPRARVEAVYLAVLSRRPTAEEYDLVAGLESIADFRDLVWALINGEEFLFVR